ncbi:unnamed protein product [Psylliodes chrysocephalus]|uniref:Transposable element Tc3 transposase n=1 Tax=Psylliodes chrysocephalus TaxID=3402493 RepID=A0A9P0CCD4_9CUCU|nr:unnamed protein product [Psylliodes chrysocephala]
MRLPRRLLVLWLQNLMHRIFGNLCPSENKPHEVVEHDMGDYWFQQDGATCHRARLTMDLLRTTFPNRLISKYDNFDWPAHSPDLTAPDFFLWGYLKGKVYADKPATLQQLKVNIPREIAAIQPETFQKAMENAEKRADLCEASGGGHLADVIFKVTK